MGHPEFCWCSRYTPVNPASTPSNKFITIKLPPKFEETQSSPENQPAELDASPEQITEAALQPESAPESKPALFEFDDLMGTFLDVVSDDDDWTAVSPRLSNCKVHPPNRWADPRHEEPDFLFIGSHHSSPFVLPNSVEHMSPDVVVVDDISDFWPESPLDIVSLTQEEC